MSKLSQKLFAVLFFVFIIYAFVFSPGGPDPAMNLLLKGSLNGNFGSLDLSVIAVFWVMGLVPIFLGLYLIPARHKYKLTLWPFWVGSFFLGAGALLPYLALRKPKFGELASKLEPQNAFENFLGNKFLRWILALIIFASVITGFVKGSPGAYYQAFKTSRLVNVMSFDFCILMFIVWPYLAMQER
jgi:hypothetical protein